MTQLILELPFPPTANTYWRHVGARTLISKGGREYRGAVHWRVGEACRNIEDSVFADQRLHVVVDVYPPDRRRRDLDNLGKSLLDALQHASVYTDDSQIDHLEFVRREVEPPGRVMVLVEVMQ